MPSFSTLVVTYVTRVSRVTVWRHMAVEHSLWRGCWCDWWVVFLGSRGQWSRMVGYLAALTWSVWKARLRRCGTRDEFGDVATLTYTYIREDAKYTWRPRKNIAQKQRNVLHKFVSSQWISISLALPVGFDASVWSGSDRGTPLPKSSVCSPRPNTFHLSLLLLVPPAWIKLIEWWASFCSSYSSRYDQLAWTYCWVHQGSRSNDILLRLKLQTFSDLLNAFSGHTLTGVLW